MAKQHAESSRNGSAPQVKYSLEERRAVFENGVEITLPSGIDVRLRPVTPAAFLRGGNVPDVLTPLVVAMLYEQDVDSTNKALDEFAKTPRSERDEALKMLEAVDVVCLAALVDPGDLPYLTYTDRSYIFRLAFLPAEVLSRFRAKPPGDVVGVDAGDQVQQTA